MAEGALRVLMIAPTPYFSDRGCHVRIYEEARALIKLGHEVCIVTYHLGRDMPGVRVVRTPDIPWYSKLEAGPSWHKPYLDILLLWKCLTEIPSFRPHLIHAHLHEGALIGSVLRSFIRIPMLFDYQGSLSGESLNHGFFRDKSLLLKIFKRIERFIDRRADLTITSSDKGRQELIQDWGIGEEKVSNLIDGVDTEMFRPYPRSDARRELGIPDGVKLVVYLGLFNRYQGVDLLLDAIALVRCQSPDVRFLLMGFPDKEYLKKAETMGIDDVITFTGRVSYDRAPFFLSAGDLAVSPKLSLTEANGKLFNYMACGLPTVVFDNPINREILGDEGIYVEYGNTSLLADTIISTLHDSHLMSSLSERLRERAIRIHSWDSRSRQLVSVYQALLASQ
ncbi:MAG: glycosyltransferase family 4 protein [Desulfuromonadaceae bacterium]|nr:glycosyltransferase family 4 protein [Desulfuromonadaceae bacterium]